MPLGVRNQRALLTLLLLRANEPLSSDRLVNELWDETRRDLRHELGVDLHFQVCRDPVLEDTQIERACLTGEPLEASQV